MLNFPLLAGFKNDMMAFTLVQDVLWDDYRVLQQLIFVFDLDSIIIANSTVSLSTQITLCNNYFPCKLRISANGLGKIRVSEAGQIACLRNMGSGCEQVFVNNVTFECSGNRESAIKMQGSLLSVSNASFLNCQSGSDGGVVQAYDMAAVTIRDCQFRNTQCNGMGGAIAAYGCNLSVVNSLFHNCSAVGGGGAIWISAFEGCYGSFRVQNTELIVSSSVFSSCRATGAGGAVLAMSRSVLEGQLLNVVVSDTRFSSCTARAEGGAFRISGSAIIAKVKSCTFEFCTSQASGGAISSGGLSSLTLMQSLMYNNTALNTGGGAVHLNQTYFSAMSTVLYNNYAPQGGGGAIFWQGWVKSSVTKTSVLSAGESTMSSLCGKNNWKLYSK
jgi:hypothetical protein